MRLLYLGDTASPHFRAWPAFFAAAGHDVHACHAGPGEHGEPIAGVEMHAPAAGAASRGRGFWLAGAHSVSRLRRKLDPAVVHSHQLVPCGLLAELGGAEPHVATAWGSEVLLAGRIGRRMAARAARGADLLTADSHHLLSVLAEMGAPSERLRWVPWGVDSRWAAPATALTRTEAAARAGLSVERPIVLSHRGTAPVYRQDVFVAAMASVARSRPDALGVVPALDRRTGSSHTAALRDHVERTGAAVEIVDGWPHAQMAFAYRAAAVCVSVPESDSAPTSVFEALAVGTPAIVSELRWLAEPVHREAQLTAVEVGDAAGLAEAILAGLAGELDYAVDANRELVARSFDRDRVFGAVEAEYERLAAGEPAAKRAPRA